MSMNLCTCVRVSMCVCFSMSMCLWVHMSVVCHMSQAPPFPRRVHGTRRHSARDTCGHQDAQPRLWDLPFACGTALEATAGRSGQTPGTSQHLQPRENLWAPPASTCSRPARHHSESPRHSQGDQIRALASEDQAGPREQMGNRAPISHEGFGAPPELSAAGRWGLHMSWTPHGPLDLPQTELVASTPENGS